MCCQLREHWVWEQLEGGGQGAELQWYRVQGEGLGFARVMCHTQKQGSMLHHAPRKPACSSIHADFSKMRVLTVLILGWGEWVQNWGKETYGPAASPMPSTSDPAHPHQATEGCNLWAWSFFLQMRGLPSTWDVPPLPNPFVRLSRVAQRGPHADGWVVGWHMPHFLRKWG